MCRLHLRWHASPALVNWPGEHAVHVSVSPVPEMANPALQVQEAAPAELAEPDGQGLQADTATPVLNVLGLHSVGRTPLSIIDGRTCSGPIWPARPASHPALALIDVREQLSVSPLPSAPYPLRQMQVALPGPAKLLVGQDVQDAAPALLYEPAVHAASCAWRAVRPLIVVS